VVHEPFLPKQQEYALGRSASGEREGRSPPVAELVALALTHLVIRTKDVIQAKPPGFLDRARRSHPVTPWR
jgi:hypothetical protein